MSLVSHEDDKVKLFPLATPDQNNKEKLQQLLMCFPTSLKHLRELVSNVSKVPSTSYWTSILAMV